MVIGFGVYAAVLRRLMMQHPETWIALGRPSPYINIPLNKSAVVMRFIRQGKFTPLKDPVLTRLCAFLSVYAPVYAAFVLGLIVLLLSWSFSPEAGILFAK